ncbi:TRAP transporter small permease [Neopusillimonas aromaticivorans]|uniref:TRAP transporter small permease n=1 Tax=Neopusillimonas aromaticivorans TaxID=2979868 RepID=UPI002598E69D|nr:TRAP transporter small permease [Neopusillimonas aromaticivorans]WJJ92541.1 TRAP transporter small permease [Neopusillimonas aromaticivorans]
MNQTPASPEPPRSGLARTAQTAAGACAAIALASIMFLMLIDVTGRYLFNAPLPGAVEIIELAMGVCVFAALPLVTASNEHIRLDYLSNAVRGRVRALTNAIVATISTAGMVLLAWRIVDKALSIARYGDTTPFLKIPMAPIALFIALCAAISALIFLMQALRFWQHTITGTPSTAQKGQTS